MFNLWLYTVKFNYDMPLLSRDNELPGKYGNTYPLTEEKNVERRVWKYVFPQL